MEAAKAQLIAEIGPVVNPMGEPTIEVIPTLIVGPVGDFCGACWETDACTVVLRWVAPIDGVEREFAVTLHRGCAAEYIRRSALYVPELVVELGLYQGVDVDVDTDEHRLNDPSYDQDEFVAMYPPCEQED
jgi:hypothetical protein